MKKRRHTIVPREWVEQVIASRGAQDTTLLKAAIALYADKSPELLEGGLSVADILLGLKLDNETLTAAIIFPALQHDLIDLDTVLDQFGMGCQKLLKNVVQMQSLGKLQQKQVRGVHHAENLRKLLLAMVTDVRAVLVVLSERLWQLRQAKQLTLEEQHKLAQETLEVHAPLANRLGVWQLKWEIEDLCLRYLQPDTYKQIAKWLASRRDERENYIQYMMDTLTSILQAAHINNFQVSGRVKHIYSINKKMQRKNVDVSAIYDISALRVLVDSVDDCYTVLSVIQNTWDQVHEEFDDYINHPKPNGYRSIHTVVVGPEGRHIEIQIRTYTMHQESELGVAAHWRYKEGVLQASDYESKIVLLRQVMAWQSDITDDKDPKQCVSDLFADRVYVFTPTGEIVDLPKGATPLDFAYHIHSEVGHRCRGAKVNGNIAPLTYQLQTGERIEILTTKQANPSRDWLSPQLGYLRTPRARAKVQYWFRLHDKIQNIAEGRDLLEKELKRHAMFGKVDYLELAEKLHFKNTEDLFAAIGAGDIRMSQIAAHIPTTTTPPSIEEEPLVFAPVDTRPTKSDVQIVGVDNLLTKLAYCCKPLPGDPIIGYVTRAKGVSVHKRSCANAQYMIKSNHARLIAVSWNDKQTGKYPVDLIIRIHDRTGLLRDITTLLASEKLNVIGLQTHKAPGSEEASIYLTLEIGSMAMLARALELLQSIPSVLSVIRR